MPNGKPSNGKAAGLLQDFAKEFQPLEPLGQLLELVDSRTGARYCECHVKGSKIVALGTIDVPLDPGRASRIPGKPRDRGEQRCVSDDDQGREAEAFIQQYCS